MVIETRLLERVDVIMFDLIEDMKEKIPQYNPLGKIAALVRDDDSILFNSKLIYEYFNFLHAGPKWFPEDRESRWQTLQLQMLADGFGEATIQMVIENMKPEEFRYQPAIHNQLQKLSRALAKLNKDVEALNGPATIGPVSVACGLGYVDFRIPDYDCRSDFPAFAKWNAEFYERPSMTETAAAVD
ncbi:MAG: glutathione S-transferase family protein [Rhodospirillales bacterium]|nr:glutathione S-transferase family protein [Rhodospirillales bacterium]